MKTLKIIILFALLGIAPNILAQAYIEHSKWTTLLKKYVDTEGHVNYKGFKKEESKLDEYLKVLSKNHPTGKWKKNDRLAFWINAYNAFTVKLIVKNYPVASIKDLGGSIYKVNTPWDIKFIKIGDETYDLNNIEHGIIRKDFTEPRIHFAVNCASVSCPVLREEAYIGDRLDEQLTDQAKKFINDGKRNKISKEKAYLSKIFKWYGRDFSKHGKGYIAFINRHSEVKITSKTEIIWLDYDWNLNE